MKKENGYEEIEYGGFVKDRKTGKLDLMFLTPIGQLICHNRTIEKAQLSNEHYDTDYDLTTVQVRCRKVETAVNPWRDSEEEADLDSAIIRKENCWYTESWTEDDLSSTLESIGIGAVSDNLDKAYEIVKSKEFQHYFNDQSERAEFLTDELSKFFFSKEMVIKRIVNYIIETGIQNTTSGVFCVYIDELKSKFDVTYKWLQQNRNDIRDEINCRKEVLSAAWDVFDEKGIWYGFKCHFSDVYCPNYKGDCH